MKSYNSRIKPIGKGSLTKSSPKSIGGSKRMVDTNHATRITVKKG